MSHTPRSGAGWGRALLGGRRAFAAVLAAVLLLAVAGRAQEPPTVAEAAELVNALLGGLLGLKEMSGPELQREVAEVGGIPFRADVPLDFMTRAGFAAYLRELMETEYPEARARVDQRTLMALDLLPADTDLRRLRARLLEENVAGFYDERPGKKRLYAVSDERRLTHLNSLILSHELRHALQDQYVDIYAMLPASVGDFDDRRMAFLSLLEGDATLVMERFLLQRIPGLGDGDPDLSQLALPPLLPGVPAVLTDQLVQPYFAGRDFARALYRHGGWQAVKQAWGRPPASTEQVLHPEKYLSPEPPRPVDLSYAPRGAALINQGVLGEMLTRTLLGPEAGTAPAAGWGGDRYQVWDRSGRTLLIWRSAWDTPRDAEEFLGSALNRFGRLHTAAGRRHGFQVFVGGAWSFGWGERRGAVVLVSSDDAVRFQEALEALNGAKGASADRPAPPPSF